MDFHTIEICAGVGMLGEGLRAGLDYLGHTNRTVCYVEREAYAASVLAARMEDDSLDEAPVWSDLLTFDGQPWYGVVDCIAAGFPCQDLSLAGKRAGLDGARSGLFFNILGIADDCGARHLFLENVAGIASATATVVDEAEGALEERAAARVLGELADRGWDAEWLTLSASDVGASHGRARWFCWAWRVADAKLPERQQKRVGRTGGQQGNDGGWTEAHRGTGKPIEILDNPDSTGAQRPGRAQPGAGAGREELGNTGLQHQHLQQRQDGAEYQGAGVIVGYADQQRAHGAGQQPQQDRGAEFENAGGCVANPSSPRPQGSEFCGTRADNRGGAGSIWTN